MRRRIVVPPLFALFLLFALSSSSCGKVIPFGCPLDGTDCTTAASPCSSIPALSTWPAEPLTRSENSPLSFDKWGGPYLNERGQEWVDQINAWYDEGMAGGLWQDTFRSFDNNHSRLRDFYPQLTFADPIRSYLNPCRDIFGRRITMGVQSLGVRDGHLWAVADYSNLTAIRSAHQLGVVNAAQSQSFYRLFYERNFLLVAPAVGSFENGVDRFRFLSPFYLHSEGASGSDALLLKPIVFAAAAMPPALKTRLLQSGLYTPTLLWLFKSTVGAGLRTEAAHRPAYSLPEEAYTDSLDSSPFLDRLVETAHTIDHIPPVARTMLEVDLRREGASYEHHPYAEKTPYGFFGAIRRGETVEVTVDLRQSWVDQDWQIEEYIAEILRGPGSIGFLNSGHSLLRIQIPWTEASDPGGLRTDVLLLVSDGLYDSAPAYVSVRHLQDSEISLLGAGVTARPDTLITSRQGEISTPLSTLTRNDRSTEGEPLFVNADEASERGGVVIVESATLRYTAPAHVFGEDRFTYRISGENAQTAVGTVVVYVQRERSPDFDADGAVSFTDFLLFASRFGTALGSAGHDSRYDLDEDGTVGLSDLIIFGSSFGQRTVPPAT